MYEGFDKNKVKKVLTLFGVFVILIIIISAVLSIIFKITEEQKPEHYPDDSILNTSIIFENRYQLDYSIGKYNSAIALTQLETTLKSDTELNSAPSKNIPDKGNPDNYYTATIDEPSFTKLSSNPEYYTFQLHLSDKREYEVYVLYDEDKFAELSYITTVIKRTDDASDSVNIYTSAEENTTFRKNAENWVSEILKIRNQKIIFLVDEAHNKDSE